MLLILLLQYELTNEWILGAHKLARFTKRFMLPIYFDLPEEAPCFHLYYHNTSPGAQLHLKKKQDGLSANKGLVIVEFPVIEIVLAIHPEFRSEGLHLQGRLSQVQHCFIVF